MTSLISLHCGFPLEVDLGSSLLFTISELRPLRHQKASTAFNTARRGSWGWGGVCGFGSVGSLPDGAGVIIPQWLEVHLITDDHANGHTPLGPISAEMINLTNSVCVCVVLFCALFPQSCVSIKLAYHSWQMQRDTEVLILKEC